MKILCTILLLALSAAFVQAQSIHEIQSNGDSEKTAAKFQVQNANLDIAYYKHLSEKGTYTRWYNYAFEVNDLFGNQGKAWRSTLFPDSTILVEGSSGYFTPFRFAISTILDPKSIYFLNTIINSNCAYTVDSVGIYCYYDRFHPNTSIVDTLIFEFTNLILKTRKFFRSFLCGLNRIW